MKPNGCAVRDTFEPNIGYKNIDAFESILVLLYCGHFLYYFVTHINLRWLTVENEQKCMR